MAVSLGYSTVSLKSLEQWPFASQTKDCAALYLLCTHDAAFAQNAKRYRFYLPHSYSI